MTQTDPTGPIPTDAEFASLLADYAAETPEDGFSDAVMRTLQAQKTTIDLTDYAPAARTRWHGWMIAAALGLVVGLLWNRLGIDLSGVSGSLPDVDAVSSDLALYAAAGLCGLVGVLFVGLDTA